MSSECPRLHDNLKSHPKNCLCMCDYCIDLRDIEDISKDYRKERAELVKEFKGMVID